ncbi:hypothetical protein [Anaeromyxobacter oryzae]|uniref:Big-1 domain-containing protein n=1 Tax=Anaeromyxobacter oryzae TaxID=2918170 RepID=A0ABN6MSU4_9BACT|nr:hypothetical protein [Anaeromyxobacter oryzae]BDG03355.1 hypothetical protein AMOR_23510 [Anaeromyxobacter oryzae]
MDRRRARERLGALALVAAALAAAAPRVRAADAPPVASGGALRIAADPPRLVLGRDGGAELRIAAPADVEEVTLTASAGRIEALRRLPGGGFAARYRAPSDRIPQVAIVCAVGRGARGAVDGWLALPLSGQGDAKVRARPGAQIALRVEDETFGPRAAGDDGVAVIPIVVPPGVREAHHGFTAVDLHVPEKPLVHAVLDRVSIHADRAESVRVLAYVVAPHGAARRGDVPVFEPSRGSVAYAPREPGAFEATWTVPPGAAGEDRLVVRLPGSAASRVVLRVEALAGPPATVAVAFDRDTFTAGAADDVKVVARVLDAAGNPVPSGIELEADAGELGERVESAPGVVTARLKVPPTFGRNRSVAVSARASAARIAGSRTLLLVPGPPAAARISPDDAVLVADGEREATLRVAVVDRFENAVAGPPEVHAVRGRVVAVEAAADGEWIVRYRPPRLAARADDQVVARVGDVAATSDLLLVPPRTGIALSASAGVYGDVRGRFAAPRLGAAAELAWPVRALPASLSFAWRVEGEALTADRDGTPARGPRPAGSVGVGGGALLAGGALHQDLRRGHLWASATVGALVARADPSDGAPSWGAAPAARLGVGFALPMRHGAPFLEASLLAAGPRPAGAFAAVGLSAGVTFDLGGVPWRRSSSSTTSP